MSRPVVLWLSAARQHLRIALASKLPDAPASDPQQPLRVRMEELSQCLQRAFDGNQAVVVRNRFQGYRSKPDLDVLLVEVFPVDGAENPDPETKIVKIGPDNELEPEL